MLDSDRRELLRHTNERIDRAVLELDRLLAAIRDTQAGYPPGHEGRTEVVEEDGKQETVTYQSRTESAALNPDPARTALRKLDRLVLDLSGKAAALDSLIYDYTTTTSEKPKGGEPGCEVVAREGSWEAVYRETNFGGILDRAYRLGRWAWEFVNRAGRLPTRAETGAHLSGKKVRVKA